MIHRACLLLCLSLLAQKPEIHEPMVTDRPSMSEASTILLKGAFQVESGSSVAWENDPNARYIRYNYNTTVFKYGLNEYFELRCISGYEDHQVQSPSLQEFRTVGFTPLVFGAKIKLAEKKGFWPDASVISHLALPIGSSNFLPGGISNKLCLSVTHELSPYICFGYNLSGYWEDKADPDFLYTALFDFSILPKLCAFVELYSINTSRNYAYFDLHGDGGICFNITPVVQYDLSAGVGLSRNTPDYFIDTGISIRLIK